VEAYRFLKMRVVLVVPIATVTGEFYNWPWAITFSPSLAAGIQNTRRVCVPEPPPSRDNPACVFVFFADARNEKWNLANTYFGAHSLTDLNRAPRGAVDWSCTKWKGCGVERGGSGFHESSLHWPEIPRSLTTLFTVAIPFRLAAR